MPRIKRVSFDLLDNYISSRVRKPQEDKIKTLIVRELLSEGLTQKQREYVILRYQKGMKATEIAKIYGVNKSTVSRTLTRAKIRIAKALDRRLLKEDFLNTLKSNTVL